MERKAKMKSVKNIIRQINDTKLFSIDHHISVKVEDTIYWNTKSGVYIKIDSTREQIYREIIKTHNRQ